ncbi:MAG TPA: hypothetical protein VGC84_09780 [Ilumatobacteraceae bacterium]|jgi:hypothetical protein
MNDNDGTFGLAIANKAVELDVAGVLGEFLSGEFSVDRSIGEATWSGGKSEFFAVRWTFTGKHTGRIPGFGHTFIEATDNAVTVTGLTLVENTAPGQRVDDLDSLLRGGTVRFQRFIDWLAMFAQIGVLHLGRPMSIGDIRFVPPDRGTSRLPGYNDEHQAR